MAPEIIALKAIYEGSNRNVFHYLGLRFYLNTSCSGKNRWIREICCEQVQNSAPAAIKLLQFKNFNPVDRSPQFRDLVTLSPIESLAEAALLFHCSKFKSFQPAPNVFSYHLSPEQNTSSIFNPYFLAWKKRHLQISHWAKSHGGVIQFLDLKKFYPSIKSYDAEKIWGLASKNSDLGADWKKFGEFLINRHLMISRNFSLKGDLLTGPLFSHLLANLLLDQIDREMARQTEVGYLRYVDDITLIGPVDKVKKFTDKLANDLLEKFGLTFHDQGSPEKTLSFPSSQWTLEEPAEFKKATEMWMSFVSGLKQYLTSNPSDAQLLKEALKKEGFGIPIKNYEKAIRESSHLFKKLSLWAYRKPWLKKILQFKTIPDLIQTGLQTRQAFLDAFNKLFDGNFPSLGTWDRKILGSRLKYIFPRVILLISARDLAAPTGKIQNIPEMELWYRLASLYQKRDFRKIISLGFKPAEFLAPILFSRDESFSLPFETIASLNEPEIQALSIFCFYGRVKDFRPSDNELLKFASGQNFKDLINLDSKTCESLYIKELAFLKGNNPLMPISETLFTAFDPDEELLSTLQIQINSLLY